MSASTSRPASDGTPLSLADTAYGAIRDQLVLLDIAPGDPINDGALAQSLGFGRTPVREALKRLELDRLVVSYPRRGTFAARIDITDLAYICEIRIHLEPVAAGRAAVHANDAERAELGALIERIEQLGAGNPDRRELIQADMEVHRSVYRIAGNPYLEDTLIRFDNLATRIWCLVLDRLPQVGSHVVEHVELLREIVDGDATAAQKLAESHVAGFEKAIREVL